MPAITVYLRPGCGWCIRLRRALDAAGVAYDARDIWRDPAAAEFVRAANEGRETVPTVVIDGVAHSNPAPEWVIEAARGTA